MSSEYRYKRAVLDSGLKVSILEMPLRKSVAVGLLFKVGSRLDPENKKGITHLIEHMLFKGTSRFDAKTISRIIEKVGGNIDGYTTHEELNIWSFLPSEHLEKPLEIFSEMLYYPLFDPNELEKEKQVIIEEMNEVDDNPSQKIGEIYPFVLWGRNPLAYPILGRKADVMGITREDLVGYFAERFGLANSTLIVVGGIDGDDVINVAGRWFSKEMTAQPVCRPEKPKQNNIGSFHLLERNGNQVHIIVGTETFPYTDIRRHPFILLDVILGRGASSRLFVRLREENGVVYTVYPFVEYFVDVGFYGIYMSCDVELLPKVMRLLYDELAHLADTIEQQELDDAKSSVIGRTKIETESVLSNFNRMADVETLVGDYIPVDVELDALKEVRLDDVRKLALEILHPRMLTGLILGKRPKKWDESLWGELKILREEEIES